MSLFSVMSVVLLRFVNHRIYDFVQSVFYGDHNFRNNRFVSAINFLMELPRNIINVVKSVYVDATIHIGSEGKRRKTPITIMVGGKIRMYFNTHKL
jgi:hypothetical protein